MITTATITIKAYAVFEYDLHAPQSIINAAILKTKLKLYFKYPSLIFGGKFQVVNWEEVKSKPLDRVGVISIMAYKVKRKEEGYQ